MNSEWSLDELYKGFDDPKFAADLAKYDEMIAKTNEFAAKISDMQPLDALKTYIAGSESSMQLLTDMYSYAMLRSSVNTKDTEAASISGRLMAKMSATTKAETIIKKFISEIPNLDELIESDPVLKEYEFLLKNIRADQKHTMSDECEEVAALYNISGASAWSDLHSYLTSSVTADFRGEKLTLSSVRNLAYSADPAVRKEAYEAELACYEKIRDSVAFSLNSIKLEVINNARLRGFESPLAQTLYNSRMTRKTLDALMAAMDEHLDIFRRYLRLKGEVLGHKNGIPWYDMFAPMGTNTKKYTVEEAKAYLLKIFRGFDNDLANMVERAFDEAWIDFYPREGKVGGALTRLIEEDPSIKFEVDPETKQQIISGLGTQHLEVAVAKLKNKFGVEITLEVPRVPYRESIRKSCKAQGRHKKQTGGHGQFGDVWIQFEPIPGEDVEFAENVFGGSVPKNFFPAVEKGVRQAAQHGVLAGYPMVGLKATLLDGSYHPVDSSEMAFIMAAKLSYKAAIPEAGPVLLEPIGTLKAHVPADNTGDIMGEVTKRRGRVLGMNPDEDGEQVVEAEVPMSEMQDFTTFLRQLTQGRGWFTFDFVRYETLPQMLEAKVIEQAKALGNFAEEEA